MTPSDTPRDLNISEIHYCRFCDEGFIFEPPYTDLCPTCHALWHEPILEVKTDASS